MTIESGIYKIENKVNGKIYIGSAGNLDYRWRQHKSKLRNNKHYNKFLQEDWILYGEDVFTFSALEYCNNNEFELYNKEDVFIEKYNSTNKEIGYNINKNAFRGELFNVNSSEEITGHSKMGKISKMSNEIIREIKLLMRDTELTFRQIAVLMGTFEQDIYNIRIGLSGKFVIITEEDKLDKSKYSEEQLKRKVLSKIEKQLTIEQVKDIKILSTRPKKKLSQTYIGSLFNLDRRVVSDIMKGKYFEDVVITDEDKVSYDTLVKLNEGLSDVI